MFYGATAFNQNLKAWDTKSVRDMSNMFYQATSFNQPLSFNTEQVTTMSQMFMYCYAFNQDVQNFDAGRVTTFYRSESSLLLVQSALFTSP